MDIYSAIMCAGSLLIAVLAFVFARRDRGTDKIEEMSTSLLKLNMKTDQICSTTSETRTDIKAMSTRLTDVETKLALHDQTIKLLSNRMDNLEQHADDGK